MYGRELGGLMGRCPPGQSRRKVGKGAGQLGARARDGSRGGELGACMQASSLRVSLCGGL